MSDTWPEYHYKRMCRLGVCPQYLWDIDVYGLSAPTAIRHSCMHSCPVCYNPNLPNQFIYPSRSIAEATAQFLVRDPTVERVGAKRLRLLSQLPRHPHPPRLFTSTN